MKLIQSISSTLRTWIFKKKLLKFSDRYRMDPQACFYCPEMCRFSCPVAETLRTNTVTPRGKMSLLHLAERGVPVEQVAGSEAEREWFLEQCTGCGRCTEYCVYEIDVASNLRAERAKRMSVGSPAAKAVVKCVDELKGLSGTVLLCEPGRADWWRSNGKLLEKLGVRTVSEAVLPHREWSWGKLSDAEVEEIGEALSGCSQIWAESPEAGWFLAKAVREEREALKAEVRVVWQRLFTEFAGLELGADVSVHESYHLTRLFPRLGISIPMYERGLLPFHSGWNVIDCGGEGFYPHAHPEHAREMGVRFLHDLRKDGRNVERIICQSLSCVEHLKALTESKVTYWLDELAETGV